MKGERKIEREKKRNGRGQRARSRTPFTKSAVLNSSSMIVPKRKELSWDATRSEKGRVSCPSVLAGGGSVRRGPESPGTREDKPRNRNEA